MIDTRHAGERPRPTARILLATAALPLSVGIVGAILVMSWRDDLPAEIAIHWAVRGDADGFAGVTETALLIAGFCALFAVVGAAVTMAGQMDASLARVIAGTTSGTAAFVTVMMVVLIAGQRGLTAAAEASLDAGAIVGGIAAGVGIAVVAVAIIPRWGRPVDDLPEDAPALSLGSSELVTWTQSVAAGSNVVMLLALVAGFTGVVTAATGLWLVLILTVLLFALVALMLSIRVTIDQRGLTITSAVGWPKFNTALDEIDHAKTATVNPIRHFGGYGFRIAAFGPYRGASGFVMRGGEAIVLERVSGRRLVVVVDDAATAAGLLNALVQRERGR
ncbi:DUF1648 domain-containing protein [Phytoactinopolyspora mesophila]|uniref:DUF1648 domain-containing protein n=1 Tax=Phytoactinopolyspora mesophila TaxID=2650750 RepID=A0A7K3M432_9ACTN|nr:DUF1648 domain-containing protein [Phytoactinopolyspora mesophila]NDL58005.1 DUF1648 domain-containing protein [Phytoactinopolyspora mesophila]